MTNGGVYGYIVLLSVAARLFGCAGFAVRVSAGLKAHHNLNIFSQNHQTTKIMKTKIFLLLTAWLSLLLSVSAEVVTGTDGENITWSLDRETGVLTINGTGAVTGAMWKP